MKITEYYDQLASHDWFYMYSDDSNVHRRGRDNVARLQAIAQENESLLNLYKLYNDYINGKSDKPERPLED